MCRSFDFRDACPSPNRLADKPIRLPTTISGRMFVRLIENGYVERRAITAVTSQYRITDLGRRALVAD
jgi:hypothetical protein